jgi:hypothetical protein
MGMRGFFLACSLQLGGLFGVFALAGEGRVVFREEIEVDAVRGADRLRRFPWTRGGFN